MLAIQISLGSRCARAESEGSYVILQSRIVFSTGKYDLEAVREGSNTGEPPQHQAAHHRIYLGLARLTQPLSIFLLILLL
jgi:hypothetical protein